MREIKLQLTREEENWLEGCLANARGDVVRGRIMFDGDMTKVVDGLFDKLGIKTYQEKFYKNSRWVNRDWQKPEYENMIERLKVVKENWEVTPEKIIEACNNEVKKAKESTRYKTKETVLNDLRSEIKSMSKRVDTEDIIDLIDERLNEDNEDDE